MTEEFMARLQQFLAKADNQSLRGEPATNDQIAEAEQALGVTFDPDYRRFIQSFGGAYAGLSVHAFHNGSSIGRETVTELTLSFRDDYRQTDMAELLNESIVFSIDGSGDPILLDRSGQVWICYHDTGEPKLLAASFAALLEENFSEW
jgi:hypothetical protein